MIDQETLYKLYEQAETQVQVFHDKAVNEVLKEIYDIGYIDPRCYVFYRDYEQSEFGTMVIRIGKGSLADPVQNEEYLAILRSLYFRINNPVICTLFASEGTIPNKQIEGDRDSFLLMSFEDGVRGWKSIYRTEKVTMVNADFTTSVRLASIRYDDYLSHNIRSVEVERFSHILRPNWSDPKEGIYN